MPVKTRQTFTDRSTVSLAAGQSDTVQVRVADIRIDGGTQMRAMYNDEALEDYAGALEVGDRLPPIVVYFDGSEYWLADGFHRVEAQKRAHGEETEIEASVKSGTRREAILHAAQANADHGLRRTNADKRRAVETLLRDGEWSQWSDREIARRCKVSQPFVSNIRSELSENDYQIESGRKVERGGKTYTMQTGGIREANESRAKPEPATPDDLAQAGYAVEQHDSGGYHWRVPNPSGTGGSYGALRETVDEAIADARVSLERGEVFYSESDPFAASYAAVQGEPDEPERYTVTLAAEAYHALHAAVLAGALRVYADGATVEDIKRALAEAMAQ